MGIMDKVKNTASSMKEKVTSFAEEKNLNEKFANAKDGMKKAIDNNKEKLQAYKSESKDLRKPLEGSYARYAVVYISGIEELPKSKVGEIGFNVMPDRFSFRRTAGSKDWFTDMDILYDQIEDFYIDKRTITTAEMLLGGGDSVNQEQENNIVIEYSDDAGVKQTLRVEMLTGVTIFNQAAKCRELLALLRKCDILDKLKKNNQTAVPQVDVVEQLDKLAKLKDMGVISEEEFNEKKTVLLAKI